MVDAITGKVMSSMVIVLAFNSLSAMDGHDRPFKN
jgi:hypothetical protein